MHVFKFEMQKEIYQLFFDFERKFLGNILKYHLKGFQLLSLKSLSPPVRSEPLKSELMGIRTSCPWLARPAFGIRL